MTSGDCFGIMRLASCSGKQQPWLVISPGIRHRLAVIVISALGAISGAGAAEYRVEPLIPPGPIRGVNGMEFDQAGRLIVSSMAGAEIYRIDVANGETETLVGPPAGLGDGRLLVWRHFEGELVEEVVDEDDADGDEASGGEDEPPEVVELDEAESNDR